MAEVPLSGFFKHTASKTAVLVLEWLLSGIKLYMPQPKKNCSKICTASPGSSMNVLHNHYYSIYHRERHSRALAAFKTVSNHHKRLLENANYRYAQAV